MRKNANQFAWFEAIEAWHRCLVLQRFKQKKRSKAFIMNVLNIGCYCVLGAISYNTQAQLYI